MSPRFFLVTVIAVAATALPSLAAAAVVAPLLVVVETGPGAAVDAVEVRHRGQATAGVALSKSFDLLASVGGHLGNLGRSDTFLTSSLGVRLRFQ